MHILGIWLVSSVTEHLDLCGDAVRTPGENRSNRETLWWIAKGASVRLNLDAAAIFVKRHRVEVDTPEVRVRHHEADGEFICGKREAS